MAFLSFSSITLALFVLYLSTAGYEIYQLFYPDLSIPMYEQEINGTTHKLPSTHGVLPPRWAPSLLVDVHVALAPHPNRRQTLKPSSDVENLVIQRQVMLNESHTWNFMITATQLSRMSTRVYYSHLYVCRTGLSPYPSPRYSDAPALDEESIFIASPLTVMMLPKLNNTRHLLGETNVTAEEQKLEDARLATEKKNRVKAMHLKSKLRWRYVEDTSVFPADRIPGDIFRHITVDKNNRYSPIIYAEDAWLLKDDYFLFNTSVPVSEWESFPLVISYTPISLGMFRFSMQMEQSFQMISTITGDEDDSESEQIKRMFMDTQPWLLLLTMLVSVVHIVFDTLAFKNDIQYWRNKQSFVGISAKSLIISTVSRTIIMLYLIDNDASKLILGSSVTGLAINVWKMLKIMRLSISTRPPFIHIGLPNADESRTQQYDDTAMKYLMWAMIPLVVGSSIYSLYYHTHRSWYSWMLSSFATAMYVGGFIMMTPQLFINYKLKSVTHLPLKVFVYKALNTFIDDLFAFIIVMPTMHRLSVFRDDIIFFIYLYQRWIYPVDITRTQAAAAPATTGTATDTAVAAGVNAIASPSPSPSPSPAAAMTSTAAAVSDSDTAAAAAAATATATATATASTLRRIRAAQAAYESGEPMPHELAAAEDDDDDENDYVYADGGEGEGEEEEEEGEGDEPTPASAPAAAAVELKKRR